MIEHLDAPPVYFLITTSAGAGLAAVVELPFQFPSYSGWVMLPVFLCSLFIAIRAILQFRLKKTPVRPHSRPIRLVDSGIYRFSRNPMYLALLLLQVAVLVSFSGPESLIAVPLLWSILHYHFVLPEEAALRQTFGQPYEAFLKRTRRWW